MLGIILMHKLISNNCYYNNSMLNPVSLESDAKVSLVRSFQCKWNNSFASCIARPCNACHVVWIYTSQILSWPAFWETHGFTRSKYSGLQLTRSGHTGGALAPRLVALRIKHRNTLQQDSFKGKTFLWNWRSWVNYTEKGEGHEQGIRLDWSQVKHVVELRKKRIRSCVRHWTFKAFGIMAQLKALLGILVIVLQGKLHFCLWSFEM